MPFTVNDIPDQDPEDRPWVRRLVWSVVALLLIGGVAFGAYKMGLYGTKRSEEKLQQSTARVEIEFINKPAWLSPEIIGMKDGKLAANPDSLIMDVIAFTGDVATAATPTRPAVTNYMRLQNPQEQGVLRDLAGYLQSNEKLHGHSWDKLNRAWIKSIRSIKRESNLATNTERILIDVEYRQALGFVVQGDQYYLVEKVLPFAGEKQAVRLPGTYSLRDRKMMAELPCVSGIDSETPEPGQAFKTPDAIAGLELAELLAKQPYVRQIATINVSNFQGRREKDPLKPFIILETVFNTPTESREPTRIWWGRAVGDEQFFEVRSPTKLGYLTRMFIKYNRIDAGQDWVDIRGDQPVIPMANRARSEATTLTDTLAIAPH